MEKIVVYPSTFSGFIPHYPELDPEKLRRIWSIPKQHRRTRLAHGGRHVVEDVLGTPPILCTPTDDSFYILNGKHRAVVSLLKDWPLVMIIVEKINDIRYCLAADIKGNLSVESLEDQFTNRDGYMTYCRDSGAETVMRLAYKERDKILTTANQMSFSNLSMYGRVLMEQ